MEVGFSSSFQKAFKTLIRKDKSLEKIFWVKVELFIKDHEAKSLQTHKLSGELKGLQSFKVAYDCRVIFYFESHSKAVFINIGSHDEVY